MVRAEPQSRAKRPTDSARPTTPLTVRRQPSSMAVLLVAAFGAFLAFLDSTIVNIAFPNIQKSFPSYALSSLSWVLNAYNIVFAAFLVAAGKLADLLGRKRMFVYGVVLFTIASVLCAIAGSVEQLVAFRVLQGIGAALLVPASLALVVEGFDPSRRAHGVGLWGAAAAIASGLGPPIGGAIVQVSDWRWAFLVNLPLGIVAVIAAQRALVESRAPGRRRVPDLRGAMLLAVALGLLTLGLIKGPDWGWTGVATLGSFLGAAVTLVGFVLSSRTHPAPLIEPAYLRIRSFVAGNVLTIIAGAGFYGYLLTHVLFLNYVWRYNLLKTGLAVAPAALVAAVVAAVLGRVADRRGHRVIIFFGGLIWAGSLVWYLERVHVEPDFLGAWLPGQLLQGVGVGATLPLLGSAALARIAKGGSYATASAVVSSCRQLGAVLGVALLVVLIGTPQRNQAVDALRHGWVMAAVCFVAVALGAVFLGRTGHEPGAEIEPEPPPQHEPRAPRPMAAHLRAAPVAARDGDPLRNLPLFAGLDDAALAELRQSAEEVELEAGSYLFREGDSADALYVMRDGRVQVLQGDVMVRELGRGEVIGELGLLIDAPRSASIRAVRDSRLVRLTKAQFDKIADVQVLGALVEELATRLHNAPPPAASRPTSVEVVVAVVAVDVAAPVSMVANELVSQLSRYVRAVDPGRVDRDGLERAEAAADKVVLQAVLSRDDAGWRDFCLRVADRIVLVAAGPAPPDELPTRASGADLVLAGGAASREQRRAWEERMTPRSVHTVNAATCADDMRPLAARIAGRSIGLVLGGGGARAFAHLGVLEELEAAGVVVDRLAGTSMGAIIAALAATGLDAAGVDANIYEYFIRTNPVSDYTVPVKGLTRGTRIPVLLRRAYGERLVEELPKEFRCVSVDLLGRRALVHRRGPVADAVGCSLRLPGIFPPYAYEGTLHVDGGVIDNLPVTALACEEGPLIAVSIGFGGDPKPEHAKQFDGPPRIPGIGETLMRTMMMGSGLAAAATMAKADVVIRPGSRGVGLLEFHQIDQAREAGRAATRDALPEILALLNR